MGHVPLLACCLAAVMHDLVAFDKYNLTIFVSTLKLNIIIAIKWMLLFSMMKLPSMFDYKICHSLSYPNLICIS